MRFNRRLRQRYRFLKTPPDRSEEQWSLASLPEDVQVGDRVGLTVMAGAVEVELLPRSASTLPG